MKRNSSKFGQRLKSFFGERSIKVQSLVDKRIAREAKKKHAVLQKHELQKAEMLIRQLGGERNEDSGRFELSKTQFVDDQT